MTMEKKMDFDSIPVEKFQFARRDNDAILDKKFSTKPVGYFKDCMRRFRKNKSSVVAAYIILLLFLFALIVPFVSHYDVAFRDGYYKLAPPKFAPLAFLGWDGCTDRTEGQAGYDYYKSIGVEYGSSSVKKVKNVKTDEATGKPFYTIYVDDYEKVGFVYVDLSEKEYNALKEYQNKTKIQVAFPIPENYKTNFLAVNGANLWYELADNTPSTSGASKYHDDNGDPIYKAAYRTSKKETSAKYDSLKLAEDNGGEDGKSWYVYAVKNQSGYRMRVLYKEYYKYLNGFYPEHIFGTNQDGQDLFACMAVGARISFLISMAVVIVVIPFGLCYGAIEGYYGGAVDLFLERVSDIINGIPMIVVAALCNMHLLKRIGPVLTTWLIFIIVDWIGIAARVRTQFYRFKGQEYVLAARTLGASDKRLIFRHILPNSLGTIITGTILIIPGVIGSEIMLTYLGIVSFQTSNIISMGTLLSQGESYLATYPHILLFPACYIALLEIAFNLFGNGLRDAFNPSLRGADE